MKSYLALLLVAVLALTACAPLATATDCSQNLAIVSAPSFLTLPTAQFVSTPVVVQRQFVVQQAVVPVVKQRVVQRNVVQRNVVRQNFVAVPVQNFGAQRQRSVIIQRSGLGFGGVNSFNFQSVNTGGFGAGAGLFLPRR